MIRYVLALALAVTILGMATTALDHAACVRGEQAVKSELATLEDAAVELYEAESLDPASDGPRRIVELDLPAESLTTDSTELLRIDTHPDHAASTVRYSTSGREHSEQLRVPMRAAGGGALDLSGRTGTVRLVLRLVSDPVHGRVIEVEVL